MKIDFNNVRQQALEYYNKLAKELNESICTDVDCARVIVPVRDLQRVMDSLRLALISIGLSYIENDPDCKQVIKNDDEILNFNPDEEA
jgi:predicted polyphosphate/ATP-dependent NAD kinase